MSIATKKALLKSAAGHIREAQRALDKGWVDVAKLHQNKAREIHALVKEMDAGGLESLEG